MKCVAGWQRARRDGAHIEQIEVVPSNVEGNAPVVARRSSNE